MNQHRMSGMLLVLAAVVGMVAACDDDDEVTGPPAPELLVASAGDQQAAVVGSTLSPFEVTLTGSDGRPLGGTTVNFTVVSRTGSVSPATATTDGSGKASTTLTLGTIAERVQVRATAGATSANFTATALADAPADVALVGGNAQIGGPDAPLATVLEVRLSDAHGNSVPGVEATWSTADGGSFVTVASDAGGVARAAWTLGPGLGAQSATAEIAGQAVNFSAGAFLSCGDPAAPAPVAHAVGATTNGTLGSGTQSCALPDGRLANFFTVTPAAQGAASFTITGTGFSPVTSIADDDGNVFAVAPNAFVSTPTYGKVILGAGRTHLITVTSTAAAATGTFSLTSASVPELLSTPAGCVPAAGSVFLTPGVTTSQTLTNTDCEAFGGFFSDWVSVYLEEGQELTVTQAATNFDAFITYFTEAFAFDFLDGCNGNPSTAQTGFTAGYTGIHIFDLGTCNEGEVGSYTVLITIP